MGEWKTVFDGEVEGRPVMVKIYDSEDDESEDGEPAVRVTTVPIGDGARALERNEQASIAGPEEAGSITLDPATFADLEEELIEVRFQPRGCRSDYQVQFLDERPGFSPAPVLQRRRRIQ